MDAKSSFTSKPPLGGWQPGITFTAAQIAALNAVADGLIPGGDGFPAPSTTGIVGYFAKYVTPSGTEAKWFPFFAEGEFRARLDAWAKAFVGSTSAGRVALLTALEKDEPGYFARLRDTVYLGYYSRPEVIAAINANLAAGRDYRQTPQPYGYSDNMLDWDKTLIARVQGSYLRTGDVKRVKVEDLGL
jgi:hypothetical protein